MKGMLLRAWSLPLLWCVAMAMLIAGIQRASQPSMAPVRSVEAAASKEARGDALPEATAGYSLHSLPLRTCTVRCAAAASARSSRIRSPR